MATAPDHLKVRAFSFITYAASAPVHQDLVPVAALDLARFIADTDKSLTAFRNGLQRRSRLKSVQPGRPFRSTPGGRQPTENADTALGYPLSRTVATEGKKAARKAVHTDAKNLLLEAGSLTRNTQCIEWKAARHPAASLEISPSRWSSSPFEDDPPECKPPQAQDEPRPRILTPLAHLPHLTELKPGRRDPTHAREVQLPQHLHCL
ncbi:hypothetical protein J1614_012215 [Plenodomus biglobosus]|nr:hypothetical protein J1614_012215 [Plenodomus biglobosus]